MNLGISHNQHKQKMVVLAPSLSAVPAVFKRADMDAAQHQRLLADMQRLRGSVYLDDGAIGTEQLTADGRHLAPADERSWHILCLDENERVSGCSRYYLHRGDVSFAELGVSRSALASDPQWGQLLRLAVNGEVALANKINLGFAELGGWALGRQHRGTTDALRIALGMYGLASLLGEAICVSTATFRNCSASILKRIGGRPVAVDGFALPAYNDPQYNCEMEILRFDSRRPAERFRHWISGIRQQMVDVPVICPSLRSQESLLGSGLVSHDSLQPMGLAGVTAA